MCAHTLVRAELKVEAAAIFEKINKYDSAKQIYLSLKLFGKLTLYNP